jgi:hypothetical protein
MIVAGEVNEDFVDMLTALTGSQVDFSIVGAYALAAHGVPRATGDIDIFITPTAENARRVYEALLEFGAPVSAHGVSAKDFETFGGIRRGSPTRSRMAKARYAAATSLRSMGATRAATAPADRDTARTLRPSRVETCGRQPGCRDARE